MPSSFFTTLVLEKLGICVESDMIAPFSAAVLLYATELASAVAASVPPASVSARASESIPNTPLT